MIARFVRLFLVALIVLLVFYAHPTNLVKRRARDEGSLQAVLLKEQEPTISRMPQALPQESRNVVIPHARPTATLKHDAHDSPSKPSVIVQPPQIYEPRSRYAYIFYATDNLYACSALVNIHRLLSFRTRHPIHLLASPGVSDHYLSSFRALNVTITIRNPPPIADQGGGYYQNCLLKLLAFNIHAIDPTLQRIIVFDADQLILRPLNDLFELPSADIAAPRAYWIGKHAFASTMMVIEPSLRLWRMVQGEMGKLGVGLYDMDLVNRLFDRTVLMLPGSFVALNSHWEDWNLPDWFRDPGAGRGDEGVAKGEDMRALKETLSVMVGTPAEEEPEIGNAKRQLGDAVENVQIPEQVQADRVYNATMTEPATPASQSSDPSRSGGYAPQESSATPAIGDQSVDWISIPKASDESLRRLFNQTHILHFTAGGKPWTVERYGIRRDAHPLFAEQFQMWKSDALKACPLPLETWWYN